MFEDLLSQTPTAQAIQECLNQLQAEMNPDDENSKIKELCNNVNNIISEVFPSCGIEINPSLQELSKVIRPNYDVKLFSNVRTDADHQGTGLIRTIIFAMLRYHSKLKQEKDLQSRSIIVAFEEPELYLHPSAANLLRDTIYQLGKSDQIVCTTHSPWMIDLSQDLQSITRMFLREDGYINAINYGVSDKLSGLESSDKERVKMLLRFDDEMSRVFFCEKVIVVEGDSEIIVLKNTMNLMPEVIKRKILSEFQIIRARGKASIIAVVKYLKRLNIDPIIMHDKDENSEKAKTFNPIILSLASKMENLIVLDNCLEDVLGYLPPSQDKPYKAFSISSQWKDTTNIPTDWCKVINQLFNIDISLFTKSTESVQ